MPVIVQQIKAPLDLDKNKVIENAFKKISIKSSEVSVAEIYKTSLDARKQNDIHFVHSVIINLKQRELEKLICDKYACCSYVESNRLSPVISNNKRNGDIVIAGFGPAGMFAGLVLAEYGYNPIIFEKGEAVDERVKSVNKFWSGGELNPNSNVQFGEGGAGTFSDGKLTTRKKDPLCRYVLEKLVEFGAPKEILTKAKPHIGTDNLRSIVKAIRERIISLGGKVYFNSEIDDFIIKNNSLVSVSSKDINLPCQALILAIGHSARSTFEKLLDKGIYIESKPFSIGARIEHLQSDIDYSLYGKHAGNPLLPVGEYQLSYRDKDGRAVYTFCMCPGGFVVPSSSEVGGVVTNGMSEFSRNQKNANSALVVSVSEKDFGNKPLDGLYFARKIEQKAFELAGSNYMAPATNVGAFLNNSNKFSKGKVIPSYQRGVVNTDLNLLFPKQISDMMKIGINKFSNQLKCFNNSDAILTATETRTSSPVRIKRNENFESISTKNLYPCGEGAGYAGGIMSAAVDGINVAFKIMQNFAPWIK